MNKFNILFKTRDNFILVANKVNFSILREVVLKRYEKPISTPRRFFHGSTDICYNGKVPVENKINRTQQVDRIGNRYNLTQYETNTQCWETNTIKIVHIENRSQSY